MLIKINTSHVNCNILPRAANPNRYDRIEIDFDLLLDLLGSSAIVQDDYLGFTFFEIRHKTVEMENAV